METEDYKVKIGNLIQESRLHRGYTQAQLAEALSTSQSAINRIEKGGQNISLEMIARISDVLSHDIMTLNRSGKINFRVNGGKKLSGEIEVKTSKNAAVALLCASLLNRGKTTLRKVARIEEVNRIIEVLLSVGVKVRWINDDKDLEIVPPAKLLLENMDIEAAKRTRTIIMFLGPLLHQYNDFKLPFAGGCNLGKRTVEPHLTGLRAFGLDVEATTDYYHAITHKQTVDRAIVLTERGDTVTENVIMGAALYDGTTIIRNASANYMVQDLCFFLQKLGVDIQGIGSTTLTIRGRKSIQQDVEFFPSEDPIEAMSFIAAGVVTDSEITITRAPIEFLEIELAILGEMGLQYELSDEYPARNGSTRLVDIHLKHSEMTAAKDKLHAQSFPAVNMDNLPFMGLIATRAEGRTLVHDWSYENRAIYFTELSKLNTQIELLDPHRVYITGPTKWKPADVIAPPALRPSVVVLLAMLAAPGHSILRDVYSINRGYEDFANRLNGLGAEIETIREI
ncbi:UDP-N-acetylglucosamine 1-carboxyvinyltransferase [Candidatus Saccharibacteria bacterium RIFCSPHIGHO2_01_FULL_45_15]|nr:MAG: UDP-N-acetylglucosamine 1-carboxyvinyltransferase [Candidatus Saccharibacteria bacterium RIFCSPHIGHO2_01_FULL_45_15]OGL27046.1 MAG: UDP-N-acetylglucosamine 1-carboxyvinyltransferase [Candidatus Saccharibacteria bacterium RIFCSPHIGHO2_02_FULL_46_12]OGL31856.1 MAG: UDP-N-acetylglucosamine 1-carboxyvinyltransferase [Candidatus Saccharibacteria bacterium RIFCSPHIGHO2_12_FULL_44_22]